MRHAQLEHRRRLRSAQVAHEIRLRKIGHLDPPGFITTYRGGRVFRQRTSAIAHPVPEILNLHENFDETAKFLQTVRASLSEGWGKVATNRKTRRRRLSRPGDIKKYYDFARIKQISTPVALILASEYNRMTVSGGWVPRAVNLSKWDPQVRNMLSGIGFLALTGVEPQGAEVLANDDFAVLRFRTGSTADGPMVGKVLEDLEMKDQLPGEVYGAIIEAITNTHQHAYPPTVAPPDIARWWLTGLFDKKNRVLLLVVYDQGLSIPRTLPSWDKYPLIQRFWRRLFESEPNPEDDRRDGEALRVRPGTYSDRAMRRARIMTAAA